MAEYLRARSDEQKAERLEQIKAEAERQFAMRPYHDITLTTIADGLEWSRANLYKYAATKEEIFLSIIGDKRAAYAGALLAALPADSDLSPEVAAEVWAGIANAHHDYFRYSDLLFTVIETHVSVDKLMVFKGAHYQDLAVMREQFPSAIGVPAEKIEVLTNTVYYHGVGLSGICMENPLVRRAIQQLGITPTPVDFKTEMRNFIAMCLEHYRG